MEVFLPEFTNHPSVVQEKEDQEAPEGFEEAPE